MPKKETKTKSSRKPLSNVSNGVQHSKSVTVNKKPLPPSSENEDRVGDDDALDRLLLVHSDLSALIHQIDELVVQALQHKVTSKNGRKEIESFTRVLSETQTSLKPWVPRLQSALSSPSKGSENKLEYSLASKTGLALNEDVTDVVESPDETKLDSLISPSPLVSWRNDCPTESGRQLFLLTPLPRGKVLSSKLQGSSKSALEKITCNAILNQSSLLSICGDTNENLLEDVMIKPIPCKNLDSVVKKLEITHESPPKFSRRDCSMLVMTPLKMSPPKSCILLEPISEFSHKYNHIVRKSTPFPVGTKNLRGSENSESSSGSQVSEHLSLRYPELFGIKPAHKLGNGRRVDEESLEWCISPPKTCVLMEPPDEKSLNNAATNCQFPRTACVPDQQTNLPSVTGKDNQVGHFLPRTYHEFGGTSALIESTPVWKEPERTVRMGKRPGENTLKKELWTRFEAATTNGIRFNVSVHRDTAQKGFLDRLEEVSCDEKSSVGESQR